MHRNGPSRMIADNNWNYFCGSPQEGTGCHPISSGYTNLSITPKFLINQMLCIRYSKGRHDDNKKEIQEIQYNIRKI